MKTTGTGILVSDKCLIWTDTGLLHVNELIPGDNLLCITHTGEIERAEITKGVSLDGPRSLVNLITENCSTVLSDETEIFLSNGSKKIKNINEDDEVELISSKQVSKIKSIINANVDDRMSLSKLEVTILGCFDFKTKIPSKTIFYPKNDKEQKFLLESLHKLKDDDERYLVPPKILHSRKSVIIVSDEFRDLSKVFEIDVVPVMLRRSTYETMKAYYKAIILKHRSSKGYARISAKKNEYSLRTFLQIMAQFEGRKVIKKIKSEHIEIKIMDDALKGLEKSYSKVLAKFVSRGPAYRLELPPGWDPIIDNFIVKKHTVPYEIPS